MEAIILAGGLGKRLKSVVTDVPKPMAPVAGRPFLAILLEHLSKQGFTSAILSVGYKYEIIVAEFGEHFQGIKIRYAIEEEPLGTGGAIKIAMKLATEQQVFVLNGDTFVDVDYREMLDSHLACGSKLTVSTINVDDSNRYGSLLVHGQTITGFLEKGVVGPGLINAGVYIMASDLFDGMILPKVFSFEQEILMGKVGELHPHAFWTVGRFIDIGIPQDYERAQKSLKSD